MIAEFISFLVWAWTAAAGFLFAGAYLTEEVLDLPLGEGENPGVAHVTLKRLVQRVIEEAMNLPDLLDLSGVAERKSNSMGADFVDPNTYEELLATAVLNKVIESYQNKLNCGDQSSGINSGGSDLDSNSNVLYSKNNENIPVNNIRVESEFSSQSSLEPLSHDESYQSESSGNQTEPPMSLTIEECIEEITTGDSSIDNHDASVSNLDDYYISANLDYLQNHRVPFPDFDHEDTKNVDKINDLADISMNGTHSPTSNTWEENWLFQKKRLRSSPTPVPMLVPSPTAEFRALIGDRDAEDTTDLSEAGSDMDDSIEEPIEVPNILVQSKKIIGGKNPNLIDYEDETCNIPVKSENIVKAAFVTVKANDIIEPPMMFVANSEEDVDGKVSDHASEELGSLGVVCDIRDGIKELHDLAEAKNVELLDNTGHSDSGSQKDRELAEQYDAAPQRVIESPVAKNEEANVEHIVNTESPKPIPAPRNIPLDGLEEPAESPTICEPPRPGNNIEIIDSIISTVFEDTNQHESLKAPSTNNPVVDPLNVAERDQPPIYGTYEVIENKPEAFVDSVLTINMAPPVSQVVEVQQSSVEVVESPVESVNLVDVSELIKVVINPDYKEPSNNPLESSNSLDEYEDCEETLDGNQEMEDTLKPEALSERSASSEQLIESKDVQEIKSILKVDNNVDDDLLITDELADAVLSTVDVLQEECTCEEFVETIDSPSKLLIPKILIEHVDSPPIQIEEIIEIEKDKNVADLDTNNDDLDDFVVIENQAIITEPEIVAEKMIVIEEPTENINYITSNILEQSSIVLEKSPENVFVEDVTEESVCVTQDADPSVPNEVPFVIIKEETPQILTEETKPQIANMEKATEQNISILSEKQTIICLEETPKIGAIEVIYDLSLEDSKIIDQEQPAALVEEVVEKNQEQVLIFEELVTISDKPVQGTIEIEHITPEDIQIIDEIQTRTVEIVEPVENLPQTALIVEEQPIVIDVVQLESAEIVNEDEELPQKALVIEEQPIVIDAVQIETAEIVNDVEKLPQKALIVEETPFTIDLVQFETADIVKEVEKLPQEALVIEEQPIVIDAVQIETAEIVKDIEKLPLEAIVVEETPFTIDIVQFETAKIIKEIEKVPQEALVIDEEPIVVDIVQIETAEIVKEDEKLSQEAFIVDEEPLLVDLVHIETAKVIAEVEKLPQTAVVIDEQPIVTEAMHFETTEDVKEIVNLLKEPLIVDEGTERSESGQNIQIIEGMQLDSIKASNTPNIVDKIKEEIQFVNENSTPQISLIQICPESEEKVEIIKSSPSVASPTRYRSSLLAELVNKPPPEVITIKTKSFTNTTSDSPTNNLPDSSESEYNSSSNNTNNDADNTLQLNAKFFGESADWVEEEIFLEDDEAPPGSIAEREHLKWQNAAPLANNPYSQEAIEKRKASITSTLLPTRMIPEPIADSYDDVPPPAPTSPMPTNQGTPLQVVLGSGQPDYKSLSSEENGLAGYGRDYYINDAKKSAGTRKKQELLHQSEDIPDVAQAFIKKVTSPKEPESPDYLHKSFIENNEPIFRAKPIIIDETDSNMTHNAVRVDILNEEDDDRLGLRLSRPTSLNLNYEDTRVYNISTGTTKIINGFENKQNVKTPPSTPVDHCPVQSVPLAVEKMKFENKVSSPIKAPEWTQRSAGLVHSITSSKKPTSPADEKRDNVIESSSDHEKSTKDAINEKIVEETVIMPSVRELAKNFLNDKKDEFSKTKTISLKEPAEPAIIKHKDSNIYQVNSSLTARSVPKQFREDLKSTSSIEAVPSIKRAKTPEPVSEPQGEPNVVRPKSRTGSPVVRSGSLRNSIAFFEQLKNK